MGEDFYWEVYDKRTGTFWNKKTNNKNIKIEIPTTISGGNSWQYMITLHYSMILLRLLTICENFMLLLIFYQKLWTL